MFNIALLGAGRIGKLHAENVAANNASRLYAVVDPNEDNACSVAHLFGARVQTLQQALEDPKVDAVLIASATNQHAEQIEAAARHGKAIFCEKPIDLDLGRVRECLAVAAQQQVPLFIAFNRRYDPQFVQLKARFDAGEIGKAELLLIVSRDPSPPPIGYIGVSGGLFRDMMIHDFDMARFILSEDPVSVYAQGSNLVDPAIGDAGDIDTATVVMSFPSGAQATIVNSRRSGYGYDQRIELHGARGLLRVDNVREDTVEQWSAQGCIRSTPKESFMERYRAAYQAEWKHFVDVLANRSAIGCTGRDGEMALFLAEMAAESLSTGRKAIIA